GEPEQEEKGGKWRETPGARPEAPAGRGGGEENGGERIGGRGGGDQSGRRARVERDHEPAPRPGYRDRRYGERHRRGLDGRGQLHVRAHTRGPGIARAPGAQSGRRRVRCERRENERGRCGRRERTTGRPAARGGPSGRRPSSPSDAG